MSEVVFLSAARLPIGDFGGSLKAFGPAELAEMAIRAAIERAGIDAALVEHVVLGTVVPTKPADAYVSRVASVKAGVPVASMAMNVNRLCGSGLQAIVSAAQMLKLGEASVAVAGGAESMSNAPHMTSVARFGQKMGSIELMDAMLGALHDPFENVHMGVTAENVAAQCDISRADQDELAVLSHQRAARAQAEGRFKEQIVPVEIKTRKGTVLFEHDEHVRADATLEGMASLRPVFRKDGTVTAGNASGINDGAAAVVVTTMEKAAELGKVPLARIVSWGHAGVEPSIMGLGPVGAVPVALKRAGLTLDRIDTIESNEAFAAQACGVAKELGFDPARTNPNGSGISLGHPIGATGAILTVKAIHELKRIGGKYGLITMCIGGGQGIAMVIENL